MSKPFCGDPLITKLATLGTVVIFVFENSDEIDQYKPGALFMGQRQTESPHM